MHNLININIKLFVVILLFIISSLAIAEQFGEKEIKDILSDKINANYENTIQLNVNMYKNIDEMGFILYDLVNKNEFKKIDELLPKYQEKKSHDKTLVKYIEIKRAIYLGDYKTAINEQKEMLNETPDMLSIELSYASTLVKNKSYYEALDEYKKIIKKYQYRLTPKLAHNIHSQIAMLVNRTNWVGNIKIGVEYDSNIKQASDDNGQICDADLIRKICMYGTSSKPATLVKYHLDSTKLYPLMGNQTFKLALIYNGVDYHHRVKKNEQVISINGGYIYEQGNKKLTITPTSQLSTLNGQFQNINIGARVAIEHYFNHQWFFLADGIIKNRKFRDKYDFNDGVETQGSLTNVYFLNRNSVAFLGAHTLKNNKLLLSDSYQQLGIKLGMSTINDNYELFGLVGYKKTQFKQFDTSLNAKRSDENWYLNTQLTLPNNTVFKFVPTIYYNYQINNSTADVIYSFKQSDVGVNFNRKF